MSTRAIYVVDDDAPLRQSVRTLLACPSLLVECYESGSAFLEDATQLDPGVLLLDYYMPEVDGVDVLRAVDCRKFMPVMLTGNATIPVAVEAIRAGAVDLLEKPYDPEALLSAIEAAFDKLEYDRAIGARTEAALAKIERLSSRERSVLEGLIEGHSNKIIAHELDISPRTVEIHRSKLMEKLQVRSLSEALRISFAAGLAPLD